MVAYTNCYMVPPTLDFEMISPANDTKIQDFWSLFFCYNILLKVWCSWFTQQAVKLSLNFGVLF